MNFNELYTEEKTRLDPSCWHNKKIGNPKTKMKGGVRVNNCVPKEGVAEGKNSELDSLNDQYDELDYDGNSESDREKMRHIQQKIKDLKAKQGVAEGQLNEYLVRAGMPVKDVLALNLFQDTGPDGQEGMADDPRWSRLMKKYQPIANMLAKKIMALGKNRRLSDAEAEAIEEVWYDGSDAYDDMEVEYLADYYDQQIDIIEALLAGNITDEEFGMAEDFNPEYDDEAGMADNNLSTLRRAVDGLDDLIDAGDNLPEWCQEKIAVAKSMLVAVWDYMDSADDSEEEDPEIAEMYEAMEELAEAMARRNRVSVDRVWESFEALDDNMLYETAAWRRKEGKSKSGGLNAKGVASYRRENPGSKLQTAVTTKPSKLKPGSKAAKRRKSFCARMSGVKGPMKKPNGKPTRKALALRKWNC